MKYIAHFELSPEVHQAIKDISTSRGIAQKEILTRVVSFLARQSEAVQAVILGQLRAPALRDAVEDVIRAELKLSEDETEGIKRKQGDRRASG